MGSLFLFGGLGGSEGAPIEQLRTLYSRPENRRFFTMALATVEHVLRHTGDAPWDVHLQEGLPLRNWLEAGQAIPRRDLEHAIVTGVCTHLYQLCCLQPRSGKLHEALAGGRSPESVAGHSLGLYAAVVAALGSDSRADFFEASRQAITLTLLSLLYGHQEAGFREPDTELSTRYRVAAGGEDAPSPMACVIGMKLPALKELLHDASGRGISGGVEVGLINSPTFQVLTGAPEDLVNVRVAYHDAFEARAVRWFFMKAHAPFHGPLVRSALKRVSGDRDFIAWNIRASQLRVPIFVSSHPGNLQDSGDLFSDLLAKAMVEPVDWPLVMEKAMSGGKIERIVDFGPGTATQIFTRGCLRQHSRQLSYATVEL